MWRPFEKAKKEKKNFFYTNSYKHIYNLTNQYNAIFYFFKENSNIGTSKVNL